MNTTKKYGYIDALRGYAVLIVIFGHVTQLMTFHGIWASLFYKTAMGVQLFYVVSALTLTMSWKSRQDGAINFYIRRFFRIAPLFYSAIFFYLAIYGFGPRSELPGGINWADIAMTATFTNSFSPSAINSVVPGGWSIAVEMSFYFVFPIFMLLIKGWKSSLVFIFTSYFLGKYALVLISSNYTNHNYSMELISAWKYYILPSQISSFAIGISLYYFIQKAKNIRADFYYYIFLAAIAISIGVFILLQYGGPIAVLWYSFVFALFTLSLSSGTLSIVTNKFVQKIGVVSFSAYLSHFAVIHQLKSLGVTEFIITHSKTIALPTISILVILITILLSYITYNLIEIPGIRAGERIIKHLEKRRDILLN